jgi:hypothetical protein
MSTYYRYFVATISVVVIVFVLSGCKIIDNKSLLIHIGMKEHEFIKGLKDRGYFHKPIAFYPGVSFSADDRGWSYEAYDVEDSLYLLVEWEEGDDEVYYVKGYGYYINSDDDKDFSFDTFDDVIEYSDHPPPAKDVDNAKRLTPIHLPEKP